MGNQNFVVQNASATILVAASADTGCKVDVLYSNPSCKADILVVKPGTGEIWSPRVRLP